MTTLTFEPHDRVLVIRMANGIPNAIGPSLVNDLSAALQNLPDDCRGVVLAGNTKFFSMGLDLPSLISMDRHAMLNFFTKFHRMAFDLYTLPCPTIAAINGHAVAGGCIMALLCDFRFAGSESLKFGVNEVRLGVPVPYLADLVLRQIAGDRTATRMLFDGGFITMATGLTTGLVDQIFSSESVEEEAIKEMARLGAFPKDAVAAHKANRIEEVKDRFLRNVRERNENFVDCWFSPSAQTLLKEASRKF